MGWYSAAYKLVTVALAMPVTYFLGLFPVLSRAHAESRDGFRGIVVRSLRLTSIFGVPLGVGGTFLAAPLIDLLFGPDYANSVPVLQVLSWSVVLVILRGTYRQALNAAGRPGLDLWCASASTALNITLNLLWLPYYGIIGAAAATVVAEVLWLTMVSYAFHRYVARVNLLPFLMRPVAAGFAMGTCLWVAEPVLWVARALIGVVVYFAVLLLLGQTDLGTWVRTDKARTP